MQIGDITINKVPTDESQLISNQLDTVLEHGLEVEAIYFALIAMKNNPELTPGEAFIQGILEWIK